MPKALKRIVGNDLEILARALYETAALSECVRVLQSEVYTLNSHNAHLTSAVSAYRKELTAIQDKLNRIEKRVYSGEESQ